MSWLLRLVLTNTVVTEIGLVVSELMLAGFRHKITSLKNTKLQAFDWQFMQPIKLSRGSCLVQSSAQNMGSFTVWLNFEVGSYCWLNWEDTWIRKCESKNRILMVTYFPNKNVWNICYSIVRILDIHFKISSSFIS